jgi:hypothetical protein
LKGWRRDKKPKVSPHVPAWVHRRIHDLANFIGVNDGDAGRIVVMTALQNRRIIEEFGPFLLREYCRGHSIWLGRDDHLDLDQLINPNGEYLPRFHMRVSQQEWLMLDELGHALGRGVAPTAAALLVQGLQSREVLDKIDPVFSVFRKLKMM